MSRRLRIGVVGAGSQGSHHVRILAGLPEAELTAVLDVDAAAAEPKARQAGARLVTDLEAFAEAVDAAVVAVPTVSHQEVGARLLQRGVHVLMEKPIAGTLAEADALIEAAGDRVLAVGHVEFYNPAVRALMERDLAPGFAEIHRLAEFKPRSLDINVILDLMIHDLQVLHAIDGSPIREIRASGIHVLTDQIDIANVRIELASGCVANLTASRVSREGVRKLRLFSRTGAYYSLDYAERRVDEVRLVASGPVPKIEKRALETDGADALEQELREFLAACRGEPARLVSADDGRFALETALAIVDQMAS